jgi:hypothetical protein
MAIRSGHSIHTQALQKMQAELEAFMQQIVDPDVAPEQISIPTFLKGLLERHTKEAGQLASWDTDIRPIAIEALRQSVDRALHDLWWTRVRSGPLGKRYQKRFVNDHIGLAAIYTRYLTIGELPDITSWAQTVLQLRQPEYLQGTFPTDLVSELDNSEIADYLKQEMGQEIEGWKEEILNRPVTLLTLGGKETGAFVDSRQRGWYLLIQSVLLACKENDLETTALHTSSTLQVRNPLPPLPVHYIPTDLANRVAEALIVSGLDSRGYRIVILHGNPGAGKTTIATAVAGSETVNRHFAKILWWSFEERQDSGTALRGICHQAGIEVQPQEDTPHLRAQFEGWVQEQERPVLLVVDDVQVAEELTPLLVAGDQIGLLITTPNRSIVEQVITEKMPLETNTVFRWSVCGLTRDEGLALLDALQADTFPLSQEEREARDRVGELVRWHPGLLHLCAAKARAMAEGQEKGWQSVRAMVSQGNLDPSHPLFRDQLAEWVTEIVANLHEADHQAAMQLVTTFAGVSTFGVEAAMTVWGQSPEATRFALGELLTHSVVERVEAEPWPWQDLIEWAYKGQERYRLSPLIRLTRSQPDETPRWYDRHGCRGALWRWKIAQRSQSLSLGPRKASWQTQLRIWAFLWALFMLEGWWNRPDLEERLSGLWEGRGLLPPAEVWLHLKRFDWLDGSTRNSLLIAGISVVFVLSGLGLLLFDSSALPPLLVAMLDMLTVAGLLWLWKLPTRQQAWLLLLLGLYEPELKEVQWMLRLAERFGLRDSLELLTLLGQAETSPAR